MDVGILKHFGFLDKLKYLATFFGINNGIKRLIMFYYFTSLNLHVITYFIKGNVKQCIYNNIVICEIKKGCHHNSILKQFLMLVE